MKRLYFFSGILFLSLSAGCHSEKSKNESNTNLAIAEIQSNCESPDANAACCFENMPESLSSLMKIAGPGEPGQRIRRTGTIYQPDGKTPFSGVVLYAYQTDAKGIYSKAGNEKGAQKFHGRLHGWCKTGKDGRYEIQTIRPASYPNSDLPQHIHSAVMLPGTHRAVYTGDFMFADDPLVNDKNRSFGTVMVMKPEGALLTGTRDFILE